MKRKKESHRILVGKCERKREMYIYGRLIIEMCNEMVLECWVDSSASEYGLVTGTWGCDNGHLDFIKGKKYLDYLSDYKLLKKDSAWES
jgi:hypothetical protein